MDLSEIGCFQEDVSNNQRAPESKNCSLCAIQNGCTLFQHICVQSGGKKEDINKLLLVQQMFGRVIKFYKLTRKDIFCSGFLKQRYREIKQHVLLQTV